MLTLPCSTPGCKGVYERSPFTRGNVKLLVLCPPCRKKHNAQYQREYRKLSLDGWPAGKRGGYHPRKNVDVLQNPVESGRKESERAKWGRTHKCKRCGRNPWPNYFRCPPCHSIFMKHRGGDEEYEIPHVPMSR